MSFTNKYNTIAKELQIDFFLRCKKSYLDLTWFEKGYLDYICYMEGVFKWYSKTDSLKELHSDFKQCTTRKDNKQHDASYIEGREKAIRDFIDASYEER